VPYRILYANSHPFWGGGAEAVLLKLASSLNRSEFEPLLVTSKEDSLAARFRDAGVATLTVPYGYFRSTHGLWDYVRGPRALRRLLRSLGIDLVHTNCDRSIRPLVRAAAPLEIPVVSHVHDTGRDWFSRRFLPYLNRAAAIITVSEWLTDFGHRRGADPARLRLIYNGTDPEPFRAAARTRDDVRRTLGLAPDDVAVGLVASLQPEKGQEDLLRCAADPQLEALNVRFFIVGGEPPGRKGYGQYLRDLAASWGVASRVTFLGFREDVPALMAAFDVAAAPFADEGFPGVVIESLCAGLPVIGYRSGTLAEQVREYRDGFLVQPGDVVSLAAAISCLATNVSLRTRMSAEARERSREFTFERQLEAMRVLYRHVLGGRSPRLATTTTAQ
jgi:glycosyltransferase involved in cell wall biosynthesis